MPALPSKTPDPDQTKGQPALARSLRVGLISDTHGLLRPEARAFLQGSDCIVHAGDICGSGILEELAKIAKVTAVKGNCDQEPWAARLRETESLRVGECLLYVIHDLAQMEFEPGIRGIRVVISGHSHKPAVEERHGVLFINPGSAGPRRFSLPVSVGELVITGNRVTGRTVEVTCGDSLPSGSHPSFSAL